ncbi:MAG: LptE family protein [Bacteroidota bacterium]
MTSRNGGVLLVGVAFALLMMQGCYSFTGASVPANLKTIAIPLVDDQSGFGEPGLREEFTTALTNLFISDNSLEVADRTTADAILEGVITSVSDAPAVIQTPTAAQQGEQVSKRRITVTAKFTMRDMKLRRKMWEKSFSNWGDYDTGGGGASQRQTGIQEAIRKVTEDILQETVSGW